ncbi:MAG: efflux RND transporter periplasmic adaptor subunit [Burkholderiales bacterium]
MKRIALTLLVIVAIAGAGATGYWLALRGSMVASESSQQAAVAADPASEIDGVTQDKTGKRVLYWHDPMFPQQKFQKPGKSPFMDMMLVAVHAEAGGSEGTVSVNPRVVQNLGIRTARAEMGVLEQKLEAVGSVEYNDRGVVVVQPRTNGFVERVHARAPLDVVRKGDPLVELLVPEWAAAQHEFLFLLKSDAPANRELAAASRERLRLLGMSEVEIALVERDRAPRPRVTIDAPIDGVITELGVREGMTVMAGAMLYRLVDLSTVWVNAEISEGQTAWVRPGDKVEVRVAAWPGQVFRGSVGTLLPEINAATRTLRARIELANPGARLRPGMFATLAFSSSRGAKVPIVPAEAVIQTGTRSVVVLAEGEGRFRPVDVEVGLEMDGKTEIRKGLKAGDMVVVSGQFLVDSEASLKGTLTRLQETPGAIAEQSSTGRTGDGLHRGQGKVNEINAKTGEINLSHDPMPSIKWPAMTMGFRVADDKALAGLKKGDIVDFEMQGEPDKDGNYVIVRIAPKGAKR